MNNDFVSIAEAAAILDVHRRTLRNWIADGRLTTLEVRSTQHADIPRRTSEVRRRSGDVGMIDHHSRATRRTQGGGAHTSNELKPTAHAPRNNSKA